MNILAIDTSTEYLSLAIMKDGRVIGRFHRRCAMRHSSTLIPMIDKLLKKVRLKIKEIACPRYVVPDKRNDKRGGDHFYPNPLCRITVIVEHFYPLFF